MSSAICFNLDQSKILSSGNGLNTIYWRGNQTSPTMVSLKGRLPQKLQPKSTPSCETAQIHSLFHRGFIKKPKSKFNRNRKQTYFVLT